MGLKYRGYHHFCLAVASVDETLASFAAAASRSSPSRSACRPLAAFFCHPLGNLVTLAEVFP